VLREGGSESLAVFGALGNDLNEAALAESRIDALGLEHSRRRLGRQRGSQRQPVANGLRAQAELRAKGLDVELRQHVIEPARIRRSRRRCSEAGGGWNAIGPSYRISATT